MSRVIHKFELASHRTPLALRSPIFLHVGTQGESVQLWASVDTEAPESQYLIRAIGTGSEPLGHYIGTFQQGPMVWHVHWEQLS